MNPNQKNPIQRLCTFAVAAMALVIIAGTVRAQEASMEEAASSIAPIPARPGFDFDLWNTIHVQEGGLEKSLYTYASEQVREVTGKLYYGDRHPVENLLSMTFEPEKWGNEPVVKFSFPDIRKLFDDRKRVTVIEFESRMPELRKLAEGNKPVETELTNAMHKVSILLTPANDGLKIVPAVDFRGEKTDWIPVDEIATRTKSKTPSEEKLVTSWMDARSAFLSGDAAKFNSASAEMASAFETLEVPTFKAPWKFKLDYLNTKIGFFKLAGWVYLISAIIFLASYLAGKKIFTILAGASLGLGSALHVAALVIWGILAERTPVANLYESAVFIIGAMTVLSVIISAYYRTRLIGLAGATLGAFFMGIANNIPFQYGRKILPLVDALQSYWLRIHVTSMLISYAFFAISFFVACAWIARHAMLRRRVGSDIPGDPILMYLDGLNFRIITIGFPILTGGVILGAVWASEAWGRPWAFDPKETAAAITWMIYAIYLHCRLFLGWRDSKGIWLSILGFAAVVFTYLGVSFFLPGLHSYVSEGESFMDFVKRIVPGI